jgi:hypothetical protein
MAAAPDPEAAAKEQLALFDRYYNRSNPGSAGSTWVGMHNPGSVLAPRYAGAGGVVAGSSADPWNWAEPNYMNPPAVGPIGMPVQPGLDHGSRGCPKAMPLPLAMLAT